MSRRLHENEGEELATTASPTARRAELQIGNAFNDTGTLPFKSLGSLRNVLILVFIIHLSEIQLIHC